MTYSNVVIQHPNIISSCNDIFGGNMYVLNNLGSSASNFKYVINTYANGNYVGQNQIIPRPSDGYGVFSPHNYLFSNISIDCDPTITGSVTFVNPAVVEYKIQHGYTYNPTLQIASLIDVNVSGTHYFGFQFSSAHGLTAGDLLYVQSANPYFQGDVTVTPDYFTTTAFSTNRGFTTSSPYSTGVITNVTRITNTASTNYYATKITHQYTDSSQIDYTTNYLIGYPAVRVTKLFATNQPQYKNMNIAYPTNETISAYVYSTLFDEGVVKYVYKFYDVSGTLINYQIKSTTLPMDGKVRYIKIPIGINNLIAIFGLSILNNVDSYSITFLNGTTVMSEEKFFKVTNKCYPKEDEPVQLVFINQLGGIDSYLFQNKTTVTYNKNTTEVKKPLLYNYNVGDWETKTLQTTVVKNKKIQSDWLTQQESEWLKELICSNEVYEVTYDNTGALKLIPVIVTNSSHQVYKTTDADLQQLIIELKYSSDYKVYNN